MAEIHPPKQLKRFQMTIASLNVAAAFAPFQHFLRWLGTAHVQARGNCTASPFASNQKAKASGRPPAFLRLHLLDKSGNATVDGLAGRQLPAKLQGTSASASHACAEQQQKSGLPSYPLVRLPQRKPLPAVRVIRVLEVGQSHRSVGRMVISGRMVDVCAELDRLVSREETCH